MSKQTQDFIDEMANPSVATPEATGAAIRAFLAAVANIDSQVAKLKGLAQIAEETEPDTALATKYEQLIAQLNVHQKILATCSRELRRLRTSRDILAARWVEFATLAKSAGYTVPGGK